MAKWYCSVAGQIEGPFTPAELRVKAAQGVLNPTTQLRREDTQQWIPAGRIAGLEFGQPNPKDEVDVVDGVLVGEVTTEPTKRCPFCGEKILLVAIKCRFCGEFLQQTNTQAAGPTPVKPTSPPPGGVRSAQQLRSLAGMQKVLIFTLLAGVFVEIPVLFGISAFPDIKMAFLAAELMYAVFRFFVIVSCANMAFQDIGGGIVLGLLSFVPCLGLLFLLIVNGKTTAVLTAHGVKIGLMGADVSTLPA